MLDHQAVDEALRIDAFGEKARGPGQLDRVELPGFHMRRDPENFDERELDVYTACGLDAVHPRHRNIHQNDIGPECVRLNNRLESITGFAHDVQLGLLIQQFAEQCANGGVIVDQQNPERPRRSGAGGRRRRSGGNAAQPVLRIDPALPASWRDQAKPCSLPGGALDVEPAAEQCQPFPDTE